MYRVIEVLNRYFEENKMRKIMDKIKELEPLGYKEVVIDSDNTEKRQVSLHYKSLTIIFASDNDGVKKSYEVSFEDKEKLKEYLDGITFKDLIYNDCYSS